MNKPKIVGEWAVNKQIRRGREGGRHVAWVVTNLKTGQVVDFFTRRHALAWIAQKGAE